MALNDTGQVIGLEHYSPYGTVDYQWGSMPTAFNYAGERLDSQTGLLYDTFRSYDPLSGRFVRADNVQDNSTGMDPYAYVGDNPETRNDPSGHCWPLCTMILGAVIGAAISVATTVVSNAVQGKPTSLGEIAQSAVVGAVSGAVSGLVGPEAGPVAKMAVGALASGAGQMASNARSGKPLLDGVAQAALVGGVTAGVMEGAGAMFKGAASEAGDAAEGALSEAEDSAASEAESAGGCALSFVPRTLVATKQGEQAIGTLEVGEQVWAYNSPTRKMELKPIEHLWLTHDTDLVDLTLTTTGKDARGKGTQQSEVLHTNEKHPFLTKEQGFLPVSQLKPGMHVQEANGRYGTVVKLVIVPGDMWMYNLTVAQDHTYTVGLGQWIVHNDTCTVKNLDPLHSPETSGNRPELQRLSDQELLDSVNNPQNGDPLRINTNTGKVIDGNGRAYELLQRAADPGSSITPDTPIYYEPYTPSSILEPWDEPPSLFNLWNLLNREE